jgi:hypothetical protein
LDSSLSSELSAWINHWNNWPEREVFGHPQYVKLFCRKGDRAICAAWSDDHGGVLFPLIMRPLESEIWAKKASGLYDLISPYGYGGAYSWGAVDPEAFWRAFDSWASNARIISCFTRLSLFEDQLLPFRGTTEVHASNIVRTLDAPIEDLWMRYEHKVRKNVKRARSEGISIERDETGARLDEFLGVYYSTMERRCANESYWFPKEFFSDIIHGLSAQFAFFNAMREGRIISSELVLVSDRYIYSFLGGTFAEAFAWRPNDLIKHAIIEWGLGLGKSAFVLGGGYCGSDGIYRFKHSFAPDGARPFRVGTRIWDDRLYARITDLRRTYEAQNGNNWMPREDFFPAYRG